jgi:hypothetical protein
MTKAQLNSVNRLKQAIELIEKTAPIELKRRSRARKRTMENAWSSLTTHAYKLGFDVPKLGVWYDPQQYLDHCLAVKNALTAYEQRV